MRMADGRVAAAVPPVLASSLAADEGVAVDVVVDEDGSLDEARATATIVRSGRAWTEARGRLRESYGWARRFVRSPAEIVLLTLSPGRS